MTAPAIPATVIQRGYALYCLARADKHGAARLEATSALYDELGHGSITAIEKAITELAWQWSVTFPPGVPA